MVVGTIKGIGRVPDVAARIGSIERIAAIDAHQGYRNARLRRVDGCAVGLIPQRLRPTHDPAQGAGASCTITPVLTTAGCGLTFYDRQQCGQKGGKFGSRRIPLACGCRHFAGGIVIINPCCPVSVIIGIGIRIRSRCGSVIFIPILVVAII